MGRFVEGAQRSQTTLLPECLDDFISEDNPVRIVDAFVEELELTSLGFEGTRPASTGRPSYHPAVLLKIWGASGAVKTLTPRATGNISAAPLTKTATPSISCCAPIVTRLQPGVTLKNRSPRMACPRR
ncbi:transposase IS4 family domain protein [Paraburkholderia fungorum]|uniref:Transposase IS4 family domain protein n=1 Tax=Paraburkholderia fungorum TaxID=134537 RepID=A0AAU8STU2_9BURK|nr:transposase IS4 family domain protein [Paraburkholderia fungorum]PRZ45669.1 hypothetical protein BX589_13738 [Paraburkholderia fungorum]